MRKFLLILFSFVIVFSTSACKKKEDLTRLSTNLTNYEIVLTLDCATKKATVEQQVCFINNTNNILKHIKFHLYPQYFEQGATEKIVPSTKMNNAYPNGMSYANFNINRVVVENNEKPIVYENEFDSILNVELNSSLLPNENVEITLNYTFTLPNCHHRFGYGDNTINLGNFYPVVCAYENEKFVTDGYNSNGDPFYSDVANYSVTIITDKQYIVASTGEKFEEKTENNLKTTQIQAKVVRDFALVLSNKFEVIRQQINDVNIEFYYFKNSHSISSLQAGIDAIKTFSKLFGEYPYSSFSIVECDFIHGGMEYPNLVMISADIENEIDYLNVIIHETAHQWWYGVVGNDEFNYPWLDEALTEFSIVLFYDNNKNYQLTHTQIINASKENYTVFTSVYEDVLGKIDTSFRAVDKYSTEPEYTYCIYVKGVLMWDSLYQILGEKTFIKCLKTYYENSKFSNATPNDLIKSFEQISKQNLSNFFDSWINGKVIIR